MPEETLPPIEKVTAFSWKFYVGVSLIIISVILGVITKIFFFMNLHDLTMMWFWGIIYLLSWPMLILGAWWVGKEYYNKIKKYTEYKYYQESIKKTSLAFVDKAKHHTSRVTEGVKSNLTKNIYSAKKTISKLKKVKLLKKKRTKK